MKSFHVFIVVFVISVLDLTDSSQNISSTSHGKSGDRIVGGYAISIKIAPWTVQITYRNRPLCGGSIVSQTKVLTAAHCTVKFDHKKFTARGGTSKSNLGGQLRKISKVINHPQYIDATNENDISIMFLQKPWKLSSKVAVIPVDDKSSQLPEGTEVSATGWGKVCETCPLSRTLLAVKMPVIGNDRCSEMLNNYQNVFTILPSMFCCGLEVGGKDTCQGDSGGPVTFNDRLVGIVSFGIGCARPNLPGVYTRVAYFASWLKMYL